MNLTDAINILNANRQPYGRHDAQTEAALRVFTAGGKVTLDGWRCFYRGMNQTLHVVIFPAPNNGLFVIGVWPDAASDNNLAMAEAIFLDQLHCPVYEPWVFERPYNVVNKTTEATLRQDIQRLFNLAGFTLVWEKPDSNATAYHFEWLMEVIDEGENEY